ncbi:hypothetical protein NS230_19430 [Methylobacterium indicum]|nr:hypothetical protein NS230_19430 [Methylobacterium indicum]
MAGSGVGSAALLPPGAGRDVGVGLALGQRIEARILGLVGRIDAAVAVGRSAVRHAVGGDRDAGDLSRRHDRIQLGEDRPTREGCEGRGKDRQPHSPRRPISSLRKVRVLSGDPGRLPVREQA